MKKQPVFGTLENNDTSKDLFSECIIHDIEKSFEKNEEGFLKKDSISEVDIFFSKERDFENVFSEISDLYPEESFYFLDIGGLRKRIKIFQEYFLPNYKNKKIAYAVKANPLSEVIKTLVLEGINSFDCSSVEEVRKIKKISGDAEIFYNNPYKRSVDIRNSIGYGVNHFTADVKNEVDKILKNSSVEFPPEITIRIDTPNPKAEIQLTKKYGASLEEAKNLINYLKNIPSSLGLSFHVGSQNKDKSALEHALNRVLEIKNDTNMKLATLNLGGGIPVYHEKSKEENNEILKDYLLYISTLLKKLENKTNLLEDSPLIVIEPGRSIIGTAVDLVLSPIYVNKNKDISEIVMHGGAFNSGLNDCQFHDWRYSIDAIDRNGKSLTTNNEDIIPYFLWGETCDEGDNIGKYNLPKNFTEKDYLKFPNTGAYTFAQQSAFNSFQPHPFVVFNSL